MTQPYLPYGTIKRAKPKLNVLRGFKPNEPDSYAVGAPVASGVTVLSGQIVYLDWISADSQYVWKVGCAPGATPHIALQDSVDPDVVAAGSLVGLSCAGQFEVQTGYYTATGATYNIDTLLTYDTQNMGNVVPTTAAAGTLVLGIVTRNHGPISLLGKDSSATNLNVISFRTHMELAAGGSPGVTGPTAG